jgi:NAD(P)-dependent dehydrogenase (short-subunit alcohol dehydrogenase family)
MAEFIIDDQKLEALKGKVVIVTGMQPLWTSGIRANQSLIGGSSGIGLSTVDLLLSLGASVVSGDVQPPPEEHKGSFTFVKTDVSVWGDLIALFKKAKETYDRIDHVFANAGIGPRTDYLSTEVDENGDLKEPSHHLLDISLKGVINTSTLAINYLRQQPEGGSILISGSTTGLQRVRAVDYCKLAHPYVIVFY